MASPTSNAVVSRSADAARRYPALIGLAIALLIVVAVMPSALNLPQTNPTTTAEYAPVPPSGEKTPPPGGNFSSLGLGSSSGILGAGPGGNGGGGDALPPGEPPAQGVGKSPRTKRCVGNPPRQTEDPLSPPCVADFRGDNFGATYQGVTGDEVRILFYMDAAGGCDNTPDQCRTPKANSYIDLAQPPPESGEDWFAHNLRTFQQYFNDRYQTYGRFAHFFIYYTALGNTSSESRRGDAAENYAAIKPFAVLSFLYNGNAEPYLEGMAKRGVLNFGSFEARDQSFFQTYPRLIWGYPPSLQIQARQYATYICKKAVPFPVSFSGDTADMGKTRKFGLLYTTSGSFPGIATLAKITKSEVEKCGGGDIPEATYANAGSYTETNPEDSQNMAAFRAAGVTTILWAGGYELGNMKAAASLSYHPEWIIAGDHYLDAGNTHDLQDATETKNSWVVTNLTLLPPQARRPCLQAARETDTTSTPSSIDYFGCRQFWDDMRTLFTGIQVAGPRLTPETVDQGFHAIPAIESTDPSLPACYYEPGDYTCVKDATSMWWDPASGSTGCWRMTDGGRRYLIGRWPDGDVPTQKQPTDPCNTYSVNQ